MEDNFDMIRRQLSFIKSNTTNIDDLLDVLIENDVISFSNTELIMNQNTTNDKMHKIIELVAKKEKEEVFIYALRTTGNDHVVDKILSEKKRSTKTRFNVFTQTEGSEAKDEKDATNLLTEVDNLKQENVSLKQENKELKGKIDELSNKYKSLEENYEHLKTVQKNLRSKNNEMKETLTKINKENVALKKQSVDKEDESREVGEIKEETQRVKNHVGVLHQKTNELIESNDVIQKEIVDLREILSHQEECSTARESAHEDQMKTEFEKFKQEMEERFKTEVDNMKQLLEQQRQNTETSTSSLNRKAPGTSRIPYDKQITPRAGLKGRQQSFSIRV